MEKLGSTASLSNTNKACKIDMGLIRTDPNKNFGGSLWKFVSRHTWQGPQTSIGYHVAGVHNLFGGVKSVGYYGGATVTETYSEDWGAFTLGSFIMGNRDIEAKPSNALFQHEYGHYIQSQTSGLFYLPKYATPSLADATFSSNHNFHRAEQDANIRAFKYFNKYVEDFNYVDEFSTQKSLWNFLDNPIKGYDNTLPFDNSINQSALSKGKLRVAWYEWFFGANITF